MGVIPNPYQNPDQESKETAELRPKNLIEGTTASTYTHNTLIIMNQGIPLEGNGNKVVLDRNWAQSIGVIIS